MPQAIDSVPRWAGTSLTLRETTFPMETTVIPVHGEDCSSLLYPTCR